jgi:glucose/arabinose dehydrogenase
VRALRINRAVLAVAATGALLCQLGAAFGERLQVAARGLRAPVNVAAAGDGRLYVVEQAGTVRIVVGGRVSSAPFLDIRELVGSGGERGLLGLAFGPDYASGGTFYVDYTDVQGYSVLARYTRASEDRADPDSAEILMRVRQPYSNHNGGELRFGPDGYLYWGLGDGGSGGDPHGNGQDRGTLLGAILRLDVSGPAATAAAGNPFVGTAGARPEVWVYGLRNPWRFSFDAASGDLYIGDVGQNAIEEIDLVAAGTAGGANFGWNVMEGNRCYRPAQGCDRDGLTPPILTYSHASGAGNSVTGGYVYRGTRIPSLQGAYVFADFGSGKVWAARRDAGGDWRAEPLLETGFNVSTFGQDDSGELYLADYGGGVLYALVP